MRRKIPAMSSKKLVKLVKNAGAYFVRHGKGELHQYKWTNRNYGRNTVLWYFGNSP